MADVPCLDYLWDGQKDCPDDGRLGGTRRKNQGNMPICMLLGPLWQSCHAWTTYRSICTVVIARTDHITHETISHGHA